MKQKRTISTCARKYRPPAELKHLVTLRPVAFPGVRACKFSHFQRPGIIKYGLRLVVRNIFTTCEYRYHISPPPVFLHLPSRAPHLRTQGIDSPPPPPPTLSIGIFRDAKKYIIIAFSRS